MKKDSKVKENMITLMLLACLVAVFSFLSLGMNMVSLADPNVDESNTRRAQLIEEASQREVQFSDIQLQIKILHEELERLEYFLRSKKNPSSDEATDDIDREIKQKEERLENIKRNVNKLQDELADKESNKDQEIEWEALLRKLSKEIEALEKEFNELKSRRSVHSKQSPSTEGSDLQSEIEDKLKELEKAENMIKELQAKLQDKNKSVDVGQLYGRSEESNTQYVECTKAGVVLQPQDMMISLSSLKKEFKNSIKKANCVVFLVRPGGFGSFIKSREIVEERKIKIGYEPVDSSWQLKYPHKE